MKKQDQIIGHLLIFGVSRPNELDILVQGNFTEVNHTILKAMQAIHNRYEPVDIVTVSAQLEEWGLLESVGGREYINALTLEFDLKMQDYMP